jgi:hypothetical protein
VTQLLNTSIVGSLGQPRRISLLSERKERRKKHSEALEETLQSHLDSYFAVVREKFGFKRKEMEVSLDSGFAVLRTPYFELSIESEAAAEDPMEIDWRHRVTFPKDLSVLETEAFQSVFGEQFDTLLVELTNKLSVSEVIDQLEEKEIPGVSLDYDSRCLWCEIQIKGFTDIIRVEAGTVKITRLSFPNFRALSELAQKFGLLL